MILPGPREHAARAASGQAVLELAVGIFALLVAIVAVLTAGFLAVADGTAMVDAQRDAIEKSASGVAATVLSQDSSSAAFSAVEGLSSVGLHRGEAEVAIELPPAAEPLFGLHQDQTARREVWLPSTGGLQ